MPERDAGVSTMAMTESAAQLSAPIKKDAGTLQQYGALAWRRSKRGEVKILLITSRERKRWIVPKGWPIKGKTPARTAAREAFEEAGVIGDAQAEAIGAYNYVKILRDGTEADCRVVLFGLEVRGTLLNWPERAERTRQWLTVPEAATTVSDTGLAEILRELQSDRDVLG